MWFVGHGNMGLVLGVRLNGDGTSSQGRVCFSLIMGTMQS